ncbi:hypothetical protein DRP53_00105 [candidate division WOR-3 bacterium]|uniref:HTH arsR-type domain-containing protein n=1 Tax=candidate division WOR-3 bacterium TaxID=2052148 RepID=A0A660SM31_UNCW3|nr:MAG: hypothetical protein DRP53_00105 [candidate division WOR-3 bacterium]
MKIRYNLVWLGEKFLRIFRILGNPTAYEIIHLLARKSRSVEELADLLGLHISTVSHVMRNLRNLDIVRYVVKFQERKYWIKERRILRLLAEAEAIVRKFRTADY